MIKFRFKWLVLRTMAVLAGVLTLSPSALAQGKQCGGLAGTACDAGQVCELPAGSCKSADLFGICVDVPQMCIAIYLPVCGCDGRTYSNDCMRRSARAQPDHKGPCKSPRD